MKLNPAEHDFLTSKAWRDKREKILRRDGYMCQWSKRYGRKVPGNIIHHIFPRSEFPQYALMDWNLITVSMKGHKALEDENGLTEEGRQLLVRTARKHNVKIPENYQI